ncbi:MAG: hypothetical protein JWR25_337, partial [Noviherbaspirillum sp.]|nr:hypothetical protein [Noviherbaspirillum sp.]
LETINETLGMLKVFKQMDRDMPTGEIEIFLNAAFTKGLTVTTLPRQVAWMIPSREIVPF